MVVRSILMWILAEFQERCYLNCYEPASLINEIQNVKLKWVNILRNGNLLLGNGSRKHELR